VSIILVMFQILNPAEITWLARQSHSHVLFLQDGDTACADASRCVIARRPVCSETIGIDSNAPSESSEARGAGTIGQAVKKPLGCMRSISHKWRDSVLP
jgi:hypothetical protein